MNSTAESLSLLNRGIRNYFTNRPLSISLEVTYSCNAHCKHCHLGGIIKDEVTVSPQRYGELCRQIQPVVAQVSGGEPLLRKDLVEIIKALHRPNRAPVVVITTNAALLTKEKYYALREAGTDQFSVSMDYPDERHDEFRRIRGLFAKIEKLISELQEEDEKAITLSCVVQKDNFRDLPKIAALAQKWGVRINFSTYTWLRTNDKSYMLTKEDLPEFREIVKELLTFKKRNKNFFASEYVFNRMIRFFEEETIPGCRAGDRFFIVNPDGRISPCGLFLNRYKSVREMKEDFVKTNTCGDCNTSIRANCEKPIKYLVLDNIKRN
ncbi:MAG: radical SAM protein [Actinobacteria bacterium]|nr:radical SAM protein [Actinomycetota bacterium]